MKKSIIILAGVSMALAMVSCNNGQKKAAPAEIKWLSEETTEVEVNNEGAPSYIAVNKPEVDPSDKEDRSRISPYRCRGLLHPLRRKFTQRLERLRQGHSDRQMDH